MLKLLYAGDAMILEFTGEVDEHPVGTERKASHG